jgi:hypothetical protein
MGFTVVLSIATQFPNLPPRDGSVNVHGRGSVLLERWYPLLAVLRIPVNAMRCNKAREGKKRGGKEGRGKGWHETNLLSVRVVPIRLVTCKFGIDTKRDLAIP